ncbi:Tip attachment protein J [uncultured Caudovirales phage]|uniref:Tip attachment protein J n=1 Tax=uncultured Caudovirales phage TaxID=2100421 RepID=A0A6J5KLZ3_9CAUD|nr:Tip attachment protein J [uncultured Caudovirales phage]
MPAGLILSILAPSFTAATAGAFTYALVSSIISMVASSIISKAFAPTVNNDALNSPTSNPGNPVQAPPATDNKLPVVYGTGWVGGIITDLSISNDNQTLYYVLALSEVTNTETGGTPDVITFGDIYYGGKRCVFDLTDLTKVTGLLDDSTGQVDTTVNGYINIYKYRNGSSSGVNTSSTAVAIMSASDCTYKWDANKQMSNCAFVIIKLKYNQNANVTSLQQTKFQLTNARKAPGDCFLDYLTSTRYGAAIPVASVATSTLTALNAYSNQTMQYTPYSGGTANITRFEFDGVIDPTQTIMNNMQMMADCCDCLIRYNEITGLWGVIVQQPTYTVAMALDDSNIISSLQVTPVDLATSYNIAEVKFTDGTTQDAFQTATFNLAVLNPSLMYPNEPVNKQSISLPLVNNNVRAQYLANRFLEAGREDLQLQVRIGYSGLQLEAGDIVTVTNANYGWSAKLFRCNRVVENFGDDGSITTSLSLGEWNPAVYDDYNVTQFTPAPNTGIGNPLNFGTIPAPTVALSNFSAAVPSFSVAVTASSGGIVEYAEVWYSAYAAPTVAQLIFIGTTAINSDGNPFTPSASMGTVTLSGIAQGNWYFFSRMVNGLGKSNYSPASAVFQWRPLTFQYVERYINIRYATSITGTGFSTSPRNIGFVTWTNSSSIVRAWTNSLSATIGWTGGFDATYFGIQNTPTTTGSTVPADYQWYLADPAFGETNYLLFANRSNRNFSFAVGGAAQVQNTAAFVPTLTSVYDPTIWSGLPDGINSIDLDARTGQLIYFGKTAQTSQDGILSVTNNTDGSMKVALGQFLNFGAGVYSKTAAIANLTIDIYGRVVGFQSPDAFYYTETVFTATAGQTTFSLTHIVGDILLFREGILMDLTEYSETSTTFVLAQAAIAGEVLIALQMRAVSTQDAYEDIGIAIVSSTTNSITYSQAPYQTIVAGNELCFANTGSPTTFTVQSINTITKVITFTGTISGATALLPVYRFRAAGATYRPWSRNTVTLTAANTYTPTDWAVNSGFEAPYCNGVAFNDIDYDITAGAFTGFPAALTGNFTVIQYAPNNLGVPACNIINTITYSVAGALAYTYSSNPESMEVYANGVLLAKGSGYDYTATPTNWLLSTAFPDSSTLLVQQTFARDGAA